MTTENLFEREGGLPSMSFGGRDPQTGAITRKPVGTKYVGIVTKLPAMVQSRDFDSRKPVFWKTGEKGVKTTEPNDNPIMSVVLHVKVISSTETTMKYKGADIPVVGTEMGVWAEKPSSLFYAIGDAITAAGVKAIELGGEITFEVSGFKQGENKQRMPATQFVVSYSPPNAFAVDNTVPDSPAAIATETQVVVPPPPAVITVPPPPVAVDPNAAARQAFLDGGWTLELIAQHHPHLMPPAPAGVSVPPPPVEDKRAAMLASLTPEERAALA